ncbi:MAG: phage tail tape measure protein [Clostridium sp.]
MAQTNILLGAKMKEIDVLEKQIQGDINKLSKRVNLSIDKIEIKDIDKSINRIQKQLNKISKAATIDINKIQVSQVDKNSLKIQKQLNQISKNLTLNVSDIKIGNLDKINKQLDSQLKKIAKTSNSVPQGKVQGSNLKIIKGDFEDIRKQAQELGNQVIKLNGEMAKLSVKKNGDGTLKSATITKEFDKAKQSVEQYGFVTRQVGNETVQRFELIGKTIIDNKTKADSSMASQKKYLDELLLKTKQIKSLSIQEGRRNENYDNQGHLNEIIQAQNRINSLKKSGIELNKSEKNELDILVKKLSDKVKEESGYAKEVNKSTQFLQSQIKVLENSKLRAENRGGGDNTKQSEIINAINKQVQQYKELIKQNQILGNVEQNRIRESVSGIKNQTNELTRYESSFRNIFNRMKDYAIGGSVIYGAMNYAKQGLQDLISVDNAMRDIKKVSDESKSTYNQLENEANQTAMAIGGNTSELLQSVADWKQAGESFKDSVLLAKNSTIFQNVGDLSQEEASKGLVSTMKAFNLEAQDSMQIMDKLNATSNDYAVSTKGLNEALMRSSSALSVSKNNLSESIAIITAGDEILQNSAKMGNAAKSISMNLQKVKMTAKGVKPEFQDLVQTVTKGQVSLTDANGQFKSTYQILLELGKQWNNLDGKSQALLGQELAGEFAPYVEKFA